MSDLERDVEQQIGRHLAANYRCIEIAMINEGLQLHWQWHWKTDRDTKPSEERLQKQCRLYSKPYLRCFNEMRYWKSILSLVCTNTALMNKKSIFISPTFICKALSTEWRAQTQVLCSERYMTATEIAIWLSFH